MLHTKFWEIGQPVPEKIFEGHLGHVTGFSNLLVVGVSNDLGGEPSQSDSLLTHAIGRLFKSP